MWLSKCFRKIGTQPHIFPIILNPLVINKDCGKKSQWIIAGWWYTYPSEEYEFVSWDDDIPNMMGKS